VEKGTATVTITDVAGGNYAVSGSTTFTITGISLEDAEVTVSGTYMYNGSAQTPSAGDITVSLNGETVSFLNYMVMLSDNTKAGTATVTVTGTGSYGGSATGSFTIAPKELTVTGAEAASREYDGTDVVTVTGVTLESVIDGDDVSADVTNLTGTVDSADAGEYDQVTFAEDLSLTGTAAGNYTLTQPTSAVSTDVTIAPKIVDSPTITLSQDTYEYDGTAKEPIVTVTDGETEISSDEYTVSYADNVEVGTATVTLTDVSGGNYTVSGSATFTITGISLEDAEVTVSGTYTFDGGARTPIRDDIEVTLNGDTVSSSNYTVSVSNNINAGTATVTVTGTGNYRGSATGTFTIAPVEVRVTGAEATDREYDGTNVVNVTKVNLSETLGYQIQVDVTDLTGTVDSADAGAYTSVTLPQTLSLTGDPVNVGNFRLIQPTGAVSADVTISAKTVDSPTIMLSQDTYEYDGTAKEPGVTVTDGEMMIPSGEYTVSYADNVEKGTATVTITDVAGGNYTVSGSTTFTITGISLEDAVVTVSGTYMYNGSAQTPSADNITVNLNGATVSSSNYTVSVSNNTNAGTATVTVTGTGSYGGSATGSFTIAPKELTVTGAEAASREYDGTNVVTVTGVTLEGVANSDRDSDAVQVDVTDLTGTVESANSGSYTSVTLAGTLSLTGSAAGNYTLTQPTSAVSTDVTISPKIVDSPTITLSQDTYEYDGTAKEPGVTVTDGETEIPSGEYTVSYADNVDEGTATVTVTDIDGGNYTVNGTTEFTILAKETEEEKDSGGSGSESGEETSDGDESDEGNSEEIEPGEESSDGGDSGEGSSGATTPDNNSTTTNRSVSDGDDDDSTVGGNLSSSDSGRWIMEEKGWWYSEDNGSYPKGEWRQLGWLGELNWYYFDAEGWMVTGWFDWNGKRYYLHPASDGTQDHMYTGWKLIDGAWYYFDESGALLINGTTPDGSRTDENGARVG
ncbi:MAG: YDG domain-containing protein, partial [Clostridiales bacterium]|nr:YDG domain-containing protein [Clostridiales bacterium]